MTIQAIHASVTLAIMATMNDHLTILVNVVEQIDAADEIDDTMVQDLRKATSGVTYCALGIFERAKKAKEQE